MKMIWFGVIFLFTLSDTCCGSDTHSLVIPQPGLVCVLLIWVYSPVSDQSGAHA